MGRLADQTRAALDTKRAEAAEAWKEFEEDREELEESEGEPTPEQIEALDEKHKTYEAIAADVKLAESAWETAVRVDGDRRQVKTEETERRNGSTDLETKNGNPMWTPGQRFIESDSYKELVGSGALRTERARIATSPVEVWTKDEAKNIHLQQKVATTITLGDLHGNLVMPERGAFQEYVFPPPTVLGMVSRSTTGSDTVEWVKMSAVENNAVEVAEEAAKPQSDITYAVVQSPVQTIAHWIAATRQALADAQRLNDDINTFLRTGIEQRLELQILKGNGTAPNLRGILNTVGILTAPYAVSPIESIFGGIAAVQAAFFQPNAILMNPADFGAVRLSKNTPGDYYYGPPNIVGPNTMWGLPVVTSPNMTAGFALVGDFSQAMLWVREGVTVVASSEHDDFFIKNLVAILAEGRWAFGVRAPKAFCNVDLTVA